MPEGRLPFIRGRISKLERYRSPQGGAREISLPPRDPIAHQRALVRDLNKVVAAVVDHPRADGLERRAILAVIPEAGSNLDESSLGDKRTDLRVLGTDPATGAVILDAKSPGLPSLRRKLSQYADPQKASEKTGAPRNAKSISPINQIVLAGEVELAGCRVRESKGLAPDKPYWFEVGCRGGSQHPAETIDSRSQFARAFNRPDPPLPEFIAPEQVVFFLHVSLTGLAQLIATTDCVYEFDLAAPPIRDWLYANSQPAREIASFQLTPPPDEAPSVAVLDTGVASAHPLLRTAIRAALSALPGDASPEDSEGHGTGMAGVALYGGDLGGALDIGGFRAPYWLESGRVLDKPHRGTGSEDNRSFWPVLTRDAILGIEGTDSPGRPRAFAMAVTADLGDTPFSTSWSHAVDQLAHNSGAGRLIVVAAGNADTDDVELVKGYPQLNLAARIKDPAQAANALTVGAFTEKTQLPPDSTYSECFVVAPTGGISPYTRSGKPSAMPPKPDVLMEGGNLAFDGSLPSHLVETLSTLTTHRDFVKTPLTLIAMTSEATARAARLGAAIWADSPDLRPETVRGLIVHSASWTPEMQRQFPNVDERLGACGLGVPDAEFARGCVRDRATVIVEDSLPNAVQDEDGRISRLAKFFALPAPESLSDLDPESIVELRVTLSYLPEPMTFRQRTSRGLDLKWEMQGPTEKAEAFFRRVNLKNRALKERIGSRSYSWGLGPRRRSRGTVQSDRVSGSPSLFAGAKYLAVLPVLGWWERRPVNRFRDQRFSLIVTIEAAGSSVYAEIETALSVPIEVSI